MRDADPVIPIAPSVLALSIASEKMTVIRALRLTFRCPSNGEVNTMPGGIRPGWRAVVKPQVSFSPPFKRFPAPSRATEPERVTVYCLPYAREDAGRNTKFVSASDQVAEPSAVPNARIPSVYLNEASTDVRFIGSLKMTSIDVAGCTSCAPAFGYRWATDGGVPSRASVRKVRRKSSPGEPSAVPFPFPSRWSPSRSVATPAEIENVYALDVRRLGYGSKDRVSSGKRVPLHRAIPSLIVRFSPPGPRKEIPAATLPIDIDFVNDARIGVDTETFIAPATGAVERTRGGPGSLATKNVHANAPPGRPSRSPSRRFPARSFAVVANRTVYRVPGFRGVAGAKVDVFRVPSWVHAPCVCATTPSE